MGRIWIYTDKNSFAEAAAVSTDPPRVRGFVRNWRASRNKTTNFHVIEIAF